MLSTILLIVIALCQIELVVLARARQRSGKDALAREGDGRIVRGDARWLKDLMERKQRGGHDGR